MLLSTLRNGAILESVKHRFVLHAQYLCTLVFVNCSTVFVNVFRFFSAPDSAMAAVCVCGIDTDCSL